MKKLHIQLLQRPSYRRRWSRLHYQNVWGESRRTSSVARQRGGAQDTALIIEFELQVAMRMGSHLTDLGRSATVKEISLQWLHLPCKEVRRNRLFLSYSWAILMGFGTSFNKSRG